MGKMTIFLGKDPKTRIQSAVIQYCLASMLSVYFVALNLRMGISRVL